jgi:hypothetical protein
MTRSFPTLLVAVTTGVSEALVVFDIDTPVRAPILLAFALVIPGLGWAWRLRLSDRGDTLLLAVAISVCVLVVVGEGMALLRLWSFKGGFLLLAVIALLGVTVAPSRASRGDADAVPPRVGGRG